MERIVITRTVYGIVHMQVCAEKGVTDEEILAFCNYQNPSGTSQGWAYVEREGNMAPVQCKDHEDRLHYLVAC